MNKLKIAYNSPVILTMSLLMLIVFLSDWLGGNIIQKYFVLYPETEFNKIIWYWRMFSYVFGHASIQHLISNLTLFLLLGPEVENHLGSRKLMLLFVLVTLITALVQIVLFNTALLGCSGLVFFLILTLSASKIKKSTIPLTLILVTILVLGKEIIESFNSDNVSQIAHLIGGIVAIVYSLKKV